MPKALLEHVERWCQENGWTDLFVERYEFWAFPPGAVIPLPIPTNALESFYGRGGLTPKQRLCQTAALLTTGLAVWVTYVMRSPMPMVVAFMLCAIAVGLMED